MRVLLSLTAVALLLAFEASAAAQVAGSYPPAPGSYFEGRYTVLEDGTLIYDGDMALRCSDLATSKAEVEKEPFPTSQDPSVRQATLDDFYKEGAEVCKKAGVVRSVGGSVLPDTGGSPPLVFLTTLTFVVGLVVTNGRLWASE